MGTVVVGYIPTPAGEAALEAGIAQARRSGHALIVVNSSPGPVAVDHNVVRGDARERLDAVLAASGVPHEVRQPASGRLPAEEITQAADDSGADLVVIGMRRRTPVGKLIMSSVAQQVLLEVRCPVLSVKASYDPIS
jgi:nucleotide-binding universal stress UspA family protein